MKVKKTIMALLMMLLIISSTSVASKALAAGNDVSEISSNLLVVPGTESTSRILIENKDAKIHKFSVGIASLTNGFTAYFTIDGRTAETFDIAASGSKLLEMHLVIPQKVGSDAGIIQVKALRDDGIKYVLPISITVNHDYALEITNQFKKLESLNGQPLTLEVAVKNTGNKELSDIQPKLDLPYKWTINEVLPGKLNLKPGESGVIKVIISVPPTQASGNNTIKIAGFNKNAVSKEVSVPVTVTASTGYAWWAIGMLLVAGVTTILFFRKHGRR
ncbi:MAG: COG1470 family protein [Bacillota bacterium]